MFSKEKTVKALGSYKTAAELAGILKISKSTAQVHINRLMDVRKVQTKGIRAGKRGPEAIAYRVR